MYHSAFCISVWRKYFLKVVDFHEIRGRDFATETINGMHFTRCPSNWGSATLLILAPMNII